LKARLGKKAMLNLKALMVGFGFILAILIFLIHKIRVRSIHKKKMAEMKNRRKKGIRKN
jgi:hypothetical protein